MRALICRPSLFHIALLLLCFVSLFGCGSGIIQNPGSAGKSAPVGADSITISGLTNSVLGCGGTVQFTAASNAAVIVPSWSVSGGGSISSSGLYHAPACSTPLVISVSAADASNNTVASLTFQVVPPSKSATEVITISVPSGASLGCGQSLTLRASSNIDAAFVPLWSVVGDGSITPSGTYTAPACPFQGPVSVTATDISTAISAGVIVQVITPAPAAPEVITISGLTGSSLACGQSVALTAQSTNQGAFAPVWSVQGGGTIAANGLYTAPACPFQAPVTITAADSSTAVTGGVSAQIITPAPEVITISGLSGPSLACGQSVALTAQSTNQGLFSPVWSVQGGGTIAANGLYTAPACPFQASVTITATDSSTAVTGGVSAQIITPAPTTPEVITILSAGGMTLSCGQSASFIAQSSSSGAFVPVWSMQGGGLISANGLYTAPACPFQGPVSVTATDISTAISAGVIVQVITPAPAAPEVITISGLTGSSLACGQSVALTAQSTNQGAFAPVWSVQGGGTIAANGLYTAPACPFQAPVTITAADSSTAVTGGVSAQIITPAPEVITISGLTGSSLACGQSVALTAQSTNQGLFSPVWSVQGGGTIAANGLYTAPACPFQGPVSVTATDISTAVSAGVAVSVMSPPSAIPEVITISGLSGPSLACGQSVALTAQSTNPVGPLVWSVQGVGSITGSGIYSAPSCPQQSSATITATDTSTSSFASLSLAVAEPTPTLSTVLPSTFTPDVAISAVVTGANFDPSSVVLLNGVAQPTEFHSSQSLSIHVAPQGLTSQASSLIVTNSFGVSSSALVVPVAVTYDTAARFLQQASWGATPSLVAHVQAVGLSGYLTEQFASAEDGYTDSNFQHVAENFWWVATLHEQSQLRTKVGWAWYKLFNSPGTTVAGMLSAVPNITNRDAFAPYTKLLGDVSTNIEMGLYFNYCCFDRSEAESGASPDENFGRELMQQFTIGPYLLNPDGTYQLDSQGDPVPASSQADVLSLAKSMTGLDYNGNPYESTDPEGLVPMIPNAFTPNHDATAKLLLGQSVPSGLDAVTEVLFVTNLLASNPNTGIHLSKYLIHELVTSNPSPDFVTRIANVWANDGAGNQGNIQAVIKAILLDPEARAGDDPTIELPPAFGRFRDSVNYETSLMRQFGAYPQSGIPLVGPAEATASLSHEGVFSAPSVFGYYSDYYTTAGLSAPEAQLYTTDALIQRANFAAYVFGLPGGPNPGQPSVDWSVWTPLAQGDGSNLLQAFNHLCFHGRMPEEFYAALQTNLQAIPETDLLTRVEQTAYLVVMSPAYMVEN